MEEDKPKKVMNTSEINRTDTDTQHYCNLCNKYIFLLNKIQSQFYLQCGAAQPFEVLSQDFADNFVIKCTEHQVF